MNVPCVRMRVPCLCRVCLQGADSGVLEGLDAPVTASFLSALREWLPDTTAVCPLYRSSREGPTAAAFHAACDGRGPTLTLIRSNTGCVFGGYARAPWESPPLGGEKYVGCPHAFLFSVAGPLGCVTKFPVVPGHEQGALYCRAACGPAYGFGCDLEVSTAGYDGLAGYDTNSIARHRGFTFGPKALKGVRAFTGQEFFSPSLVEVYLVT